MDCFYFSATDHGSIAPAETHVVSSGAGVNMWLLGMLMTLKVLGNGTRNAYSLMEFMIPQGHRPPVHLHLNEAESWYLLEGDLIWEVKGQEYHAKKGSFVHIPKLVAHTFENRFDRPAHMMVSFNPAGMEMWHMDVGKPAIDPTAKPPCPTHDEVAAAIVKAKTYGIVFANHLKEPPLRQCVKFRSECLEIGKSEDLFKSVDSVVRS